MSSQNKKNKLSNSYQVNTALKHKGKGIKRMSFFTSSERKRLNNLAREGEDELLRDKQVF